MPFLPLALCATDACSRDAGPPPRAVMTASDRPPSLAMTLPSYGEASPVVARGRGRGVVPSDALHRVAVGLHHPARAALDHGDRRPVTAARHRRLDGHCRRRWRSWRSRICRSRCTTGPRAARTNGLRSRSQSSALAGSIGFLLARRIGYTATCWCGREAGNGSSFPELGFLVILGIGVAGILPRAVESTQRLRGVWLWPGILTGLVALWASTGLSPSGRHHDPAPAV